MGPRDDDAAAGDTPLHVRTPTVHAHGVRWTTLGDHPAQRRSGAPDSAAGARVRILTARRRLGRHGRRRLLFARLKGSIPSQRCRHHGAPRRRPRCCWSWNAGGRDLRNRRLADPRRIRVHCCAACRLDPDRARVRRDRRAGPRRHRPPEERRDDAPGDALGDLLRGAGGPVRGRAVRLPRRDVGQRVRRRLHHRVQPLGGQPLRLHHHHGAVRRARPRRRQGALHRHRGVDAAARRSSSRPAPRPSPPPAGSSTSSAPS